MVARSDPGNEGEKKVFNIPVLYIVKCAQNQHGLRHGDYQRYQQYVTRKIRRMRKSLRFQQGTRSRVAPKKLIPEMVTDSRHLILSVFEIERNWAYAMQLRSEANSEPRKRFHMISRLRKAAKSAQLLSEMLTAVPMCSAQTKLELTAYIHWITGILHFELQDWLKAKELLESAQQIYTGLGESVDEEVRAVYTGRAAEILPQVRYCAYSAGDAAAAGELREMRAEAGCGALAEETLDELLKQMQALNLGNVTEVTWLGVTIPVKLEKARLAVLAVQEADEQLARLPTSYTKATICESTLKVIVEALMAVRDEIRQFSNSDVVASAGSQQIGSAGIEKLPKLQRLNTYLQCLKLSKTIARTLYQLDMYLANVAAEAKHVSWSFATSGYHKPHEFARLYDTVIQNLQELLALPGAIQEPAVRALIKAKIMAYKALRCYYLGLAYLRSSRYLQSSSLLQRCRKEIAEAREGIEASLSAVDETTETEAVPGHKRAELLELLRDLEGQMDTEMLACKAGYMLELAAAGGGSSAAGGESVDEVTVSAAVPRTVLKEPLVKSPCEFVPEKVVLRKLTTQPSPLVPFPPEFEAVPVKPSFFDLALNYIKFPERPSKDATAGASGLSGFVKGLLWGQTKK